MSGPVEACLHSEGEARSREGARLQHEEDEDEVKDFPKCNYVHTLWCDISAVRRSRVVPYSRLRDTAAKGIGVTVNCMGVTSFYDGVSPDTGLDQVGDIRMKPDLATARAQPWRMTNQTVLADMTTNTGETWAYCPRGALRRALKLLKQDFDITVQVGCETEFYLLQDFPAAFVRESGQEGRSPFLLPVDDSKYSQSASINAAAGDIEAIVAAVRAFAGVSVEQFHAEAGGGQFEIVTEHKPALEAADALLLTREAIVATATQRGRRATLLPHPFEGGASSGAHIHFSACKDGTSLMTGGQSSGGLQALGEDFLSGILDHLPGIMSFLAGSTNSYRRLRPSAWAGAYQVWGINNKEAALRVIQGDCDSANCEIKTPDATSNPHLALAAIATAGLLGLRRHGRLPAAVAADPATLSRERRQQDGIRALPSSLLAALDALAADQELLDGLKETVGEPLLKAHTAVKRAEVKRWTNASASEEVAELWARF